MIWGERKTNRRVYGATSKVGDKADNERNFAAEEVNKEKEKRRRGTQTESIKQDNGMRHNHLRNSESKKYQ